MPYTVSVAVVMLQEPVARIAMRPTYTPAFALDPGTTARTMSRIAVLHDTACLGRFVGKPSGVSPTHLATVPSHRPNGQRREPMRLG